MHHLVVCTEKEGRDRDFKDRKKKNDTSQIKYLP
jgi:hypothetical protein